MSIPLVVLLAHGDRVIREKDVAIVAIAFTHARRMQNDLVVTNLFTKKTIFGRPACKQIALELQRLRKKNLLEILLIYSSRQSLK